jgi:hypothetical protein
VTQFIAVIAINLVTPKAADRRELLFNKPAKMGLVRKSFTVETRQLSKTKKLGDENFLRHRSPFRERQKTYFYHLCIKNGRHP